jgi:hypothetical protein
MGTVGRPSRGPRAGTWLGWGAALAAVLVVAFIVGRAGPEAGLSSPTPSPTPAPMTIAFGTALDAASGEAINPTERFRAGDPIAYSVGLAAPPGVDSILVEIVRLEGDAETVVQRPSRQGIVASSSLIAFKFAVPTSDLLTAWGPGDYAMRIYLPNAAAPFATGRFTLVASLTAS